MLYAMLRNPSFTSALLIPMDLAVRLKMASCAEKGGSVPLEVGMDYASGKEVRSIHPIRIEVQDTAGHLTDDSSFAALENGVFRWYISVPLNAAAGDWKVTVTDLASGKTVEQVLTVR